MNSYVKISKMKLEKYKVKVKVKKSSVKGLLGGLLGMPSVKCQVIRGLSKRVA